MKSPGKSPVKKATLPKNKKMPNGRSRGNTAATLGNGMGKRYGAYGGYKGVSTKKVKGLTNGLIRDEVNSLRRDKASIRRDARHEMQKARRDYRRGKGDLEHVFGETGDYINYLNDQNAAMFEGQQAQSAASSAALQSALGDSYSGASNDAIAELQRLGISGGGNLSGLVADQANAQAMGQAMGQNAQQSLGMMGANAGALGNLVAGMNQGSYMSAMGQNLNARNDQMTTIRQGKQDAFNEIRDSIRDVKGSRRDLFMQFLNQLQQTGWGQYMDQQNLNLQRRALNKS